MKVDLLLIEGSIVIELPVLRRSTDSFAENIQPIFPKQWHSDFEQADVRLWVAALSITSRLMTASRWEADPIQGHILDAATTAFGQEQSSTHQKFSVAPVKFTWCSGSLPVLS